MQQVEGLQLRVSKHLIRLKLRIYCHWLTGDRINSRARNHYQDGEVCFACEKADLVYSVISRSDEQLLEDGEDSCMTWTR